MNARHGKQKAHWINWVYWPFGLVFCLSIGLFFGAFIRFTDDVAQMRATHNMIETDAIVVLTGGAKRIQTAVRLLQQNEGKQLFISGVNPKVSRTELRRVSGASADLFECCIEFGIQAQDTSGNGKEIAAWAGQNGFESITVVTNNYHMRRSIFELQNVSTQMKFEPYPIEGLSMDDYAWLKDTESLRLLIREFIKLNLAYVR